MPIMKNCMSFDRYQLHDMHYWKNNQIDKRIKKTER